MRVRFILNPLMGLRREKRDVNSIERGEMAMIGNSNFESSIT